MRAYLDYAATTPMDSRVLSILSEYGRLALNPNSLHQAGQKARRHLERSREMIAELLGLGNASEVLFTSSATESANWILRGLKRGTETLHVSASQLEHSCITDTLEVLEKQEQCVWQHWSSNEGGQVVIPEAHNAQADVYCLMTVNNETGIRQPLDRFREWKRENSEHSIWVADCTQSAGKELHPTDADLAFFASHKIYGPPGIACVAGKGIRKLEPMLLGGPQEDNKRAGTPPVALAIAFAEALKLMVTEKEERKAHVREMETFFLSRVFDRLGEEFVKLNGDDSLRMRGIMNLSFAGFEGTDLVIALDQRGVQVSPGAACSTGVVSVSPILKAMYPSDSARAAGGVRFCFSHLTTKEEVSWAVDQLCAILLHHQGKMRSS
ncbi:MAG: aminotransferase class V-fold PLP-dependent enzyme [Candidatus Sumerlaeia bacterium]|nr:aminotransferase class V-fold PLP-dependent enzyme [Candidatus Sumerlaeia bacterium]